MNQRASRIRRFMGLADQALNTAQTNLDSDDYRAAANRAYYAVFYAASAVLLTRGIERRRHSGVISAFREHFVRSGIIETEYSGIYDESLVVREDADCSVELTVGLDTVESGLRQAHRFVQRMHEYLVEMDLEDE